MVKQEAKESHQRFEVTSSQKVIMAIHSSDSAM
jgi:hypothetical protein